MDGKLIFLRTAILFLLTFAGHTYASSARAADMGERPTPDVEIDRSVLQELEGYRPPPMFGASPVAPPAPAPASAPLPERPKLTQPAVEDVLTHPVENTKVLTQPVPMTAPASPAKMPGPAAVAGAEKSPPTKTVTVQEPPPLPTKKPARISQLAKTEKPTEEPKAKPEPEKEKKAESPPKQSPLPVPTGDVAAKELPVPDKNKAYKPSAKPTMPAVPMEEVESKKLDAFNLPPTMPMADKDVGAPKELAKPTPGERLMDQALTTRMADEKSPALKEALGIQESSMVSIEFKPNLSDLNADQKSILDSDVLPRLKKEKNLRLQIQAFASSTKDGKSTARRLSLSRALSLRSYLLEKGFTPDRMDIRALGDNTLEKPMDRVDLVFASPK
jgi:outer membrane protein OmpA-like peptidoglycan-associated protein